MTTLGHSLRDAARTHQQRLNSLLTRTITRTPVRPWFSESEVDGQRTQIVTFAFQQPGGGTGRTRLQTRYGPVDLHFRQTCDAVPIENSNLVQLRTLAYGYNLQPLEMDDQLIRWEYVRFPGEDARWCLHHVQGLINFGFPATRNTHYQINLNDWHLPTGRVDIEDVIRFCLHDLGARPNDPGWHETLLANLVPA